MDLQSDELEYEHYKKIKSYNYQMSDLIARGRTPASMVFVMNRKILTFGDVRDDVYFEFFDTGDGVAYHPDGSFKVVLDSQHLRTVNPQTRLVDGGLPLELEVYNSLQGNCFSKNDREKLTGKWLTEEEAKKNPIWLAFARGNQELLDKYASKVFKFLRDNYQDYEMRKGMGVFLSKTQDVPSLRAWFFGGFEFARGRSSANGSYNLNYDGCRAASLLYLHSDAPKN